MDAARYKRVQEIFVAVDVLPPSDQAAAIERECAGDPSLASEVRSLLGRADEASLFVRRPPPETPSQLAVERRRRALWNEEQRRVLHGRLRYLFAIYVPLIALSLFRSSELFGSFTKLATLPSVGIASGIAVMVCAGAFILALRTPSWRALRISECVLVASVAFVLFVWHYTWLSNGVTLASPPSTAIDDLLAESYWVISPNRTFHYRMGSMQFAFPINNSWGALVTFYCLIVPNTRRRGAVMLGVFMLGAASIFIAAAAAEPHLRPYAAASMASCMLSMGVVGVVALFIGLKIQALRREVFDAKQVGQYRLLRLLGRGAMGEVYLAQHRLLRRPCAVKLIHPDQVQSREWLARFEREAQAMAQLTHASSVEVYDFGRTDDDSFFYAMEYLPGLSLDALVRRHGPLPPERVAYLLRQVCGALSEAHGKGLIHRDIKPGNIFVCERGGVHDVVKLLDFGLVHFVAAPHADEAPPGAKSAPSAHLNGVRDGGSSITRIGQILGTPAYMSPEQVSMQEADARSDIYSLGGVAFFLLTGEPPFTAETVEEYCAAHLSRPPPRLRDYNRTLPAALEAVVTRCLAKDRDARYQNVEELLSALEATEAAGAWNSAKAAAWWRTHAPPLAAT